MYNITDNFLPAEEFHAVKQMLESDEFIWHYNNYSVDKNRQADSLPQFIHNFIRINGSQAGVPSSQFIEGLNPVFARIPNLCTILRAKANLTLRTEENIVSGMHVDTERPFDGLTSVLYFNDTDGGTKLVTGEIIECKANRLLTFDNRIEHSAITCTDQARRIVLNLNYTVWE